MVEISMSNPTSTSSELYWDPIDPALRNDPYPLWKRLRDEAPLYHNERYDFWTLSRYADIERAHKDHGRFSSNHTTTLEMMGPDPIDDTGLFIWLDPPKHTRYRSLVARAFTPRAIGHLEERVRVIAGELLDAGAAKGTFDYVEDFAAVLPPTVISSLLGIPPSDRDYMRRVVDDIFHNEDGVGMMNETSFKANADLREYLIAAMDERRTAPRDDLLSHLVHAEFTDEEGTHRLTPMTAAEFGLMLFTAGSETVARLLGWFGSVLEEHPDQRAELAADRSLIPNTVEELLRFEAPSPVQARWTMEPVDVHGQTIPKDSKVILLTGAAGRDERAYDDPDRFDIHRRFDHHVALGFGLHYCLGAALARLEGRVGIEETLKRFPTWTVDRDQSELLYTSTVRGYLRLPITV